MQGTDGNRCGIRKTELEAFAELKTKLISPLVLDLPKPKENTLSTMTDVMNR